MLRSPPTHRSVRNPYASEWAGCAEQVKVLYARNLTLECTEEALKTAFEVHGKVERVKKIKDYAFIHFEEREPALKVGTALVTSVAVVAHDGADVNQSTGLAFDVDLHSSWQNCIFPELCLRFSAG